MFKYLNHLNRGISTFLAIGIIVVLVIMVAGGISAYQYYYSVKKEQPKIQTLNYYIVKKEQLDKKEQPDTQRPTKKNPTISSKDKLTPEELSQRLKECENIQDYSMQKTCYGNLAIDANDPSLCPEHGFDRCRYFVFMWNTDLCSDIPIKKPAFELHFYDLAIFQDLEKKQECIKKIAINTKDPELCLNLYDSMVSDCQNAIALELNDPSLKCSGPLSCAVRLAINKKDISICERKNDKAWCIAMFPKLLQEYIEDPECYGQPMGGYIPAIEDTISGKKRRYDYSYPNSYDKGVNDYPKDIAPESAFQHILSIPFNLSNVLLRVYKNRSNSGRTVFIRLVKYFPLNNSSELVGDIRIKHGANWGGIYIPMAISKDDSHILFKSLMGVPAAGGRSATLGYAYLSLGSLKYDKCGYLDPEAFAYDKTYFYDGFSKALFYSEEKNVPPSPRPGPHYKSAIKFINIITGETKTLLEEPNTIYEIINIDEESGVVNFKSCPWQEFKRSCSTSDGSAQSRSISLP